MLCAFLAAEPNEAEKKRETFPRVGCTFAPIHRGGAYVGLGVLPSSFAKRGQSISLVGSRACQCRDLNLRD